MDPALVMSDVCRAERHRGGRRSLVGPAAAAAVWRQTGLADWPPPMFAELRNGRLHTTIGDVTTSALSPGMIAAAGSLEIALIATPPSFKVGERVCTRHRVHAPGASIGRPGTADIQIYGDAELVGPVSDPHVILSLTNLGWMIRDDDSSNGTHVSATGMKRVPLNPSHPLRVVDGMTVDLPEGISFRITVVGQAGGKTVINREAADRPAAGVWPADEELAALLEVLIKPYRDGEKLPTFNVEYVMEELGWARGFAHERRKKLAKHPKIKAHLPSQLRVKFPELAAACARAFPDLLDLPREE